jgi:glycosyltransferase involved in cell wall biosynthesis
LRYSRFSANGPQSIPYDVTTLADACLHGVDIILLLGVSGAIALPFVRLCSRARIATNIDGIEWRRAKWRKAARCFLRFSERLAVRFSHRVIADNYSIADYLKETYGVDAEVIEYGGDHAAAPPEQSAGPTVFELDLPGAYALALCRIEPENNVAMILEGFAKAGRSLVFVGNWNGSAYGRDLRSRYAAQEGLHLLDPIYEPGLLHHVRAHASSYIHGHSAGGTNPSLVEMMHFGMPILAFDCVYNRSTTEDAATYFAGARDLARLVTQASDARRDKEQGEAMRAIALRRYTWERVGARYFEVFRSLTTDEGHRAAQSPRTASGAPHGSTASTAPTSSS